MNKEFYPKSSAPWIPYKIPPVVSRENPNEVYALSFSDEAVTETNPSKFLEWRKIDPLPEGINVGDLIYWNGEEWAILENPQPENTLEWKVFNVCENGNPSEYYILAINK